MNSRPSWAATELQLGLQEPEMALLSLLMLLPPSVRLPSLRVLAQGEKRVEINRLTGVVEAARRHFRGVQSQ